MFPISRLFRSSRRAVDAATQRMFLVAIALLAVSVGVWAVSLNNTSLAGEFKAAVPRTPITCFDSDNSAENIFSPGNPGYVNVNSTVFDIYIDGQNTGTSYGENGVSMADYCLDENTLVEYTCASSGTKQTLGSFVAECASCAGGACIVPDPNTIPCGDDVCEQQSTTLMVTGATLGADNTITVRGVAHKVRVLKTSATEATLEIDGISRIFTVGQSVTHFGTKGGIAVLLKDLFITDAAKKAATLILVLGENSQSCATDCTALPPTTPFCGNAVCDNTAVTLTVGQSSPVAQGGVSHTLKLVQISTSTSTVLVEVDGQLEVVPVKNEYVINRPTGKLDIVAEMANAGDGDAILVAVKFTVGENKVSCVADCGIKIDDGGIAVSKLLPDFDPTTVHFSNKGLELKVKPTVTIANKGNKDFRKSVASSCMLFYPKTATAKSSHKSATVISTLDIPAGKTGEQVCRNADRWILDRKGTYTYSFRVDVVNAVEELSEKNNFINKTFVVD